MVTYLLALNSSRLGHSRYNGFGLVSRIRVETHLAPLSGRCRFLRRETQGTSRDRGGTCPGLICLQAFGLRSKMRQIEWKMRQRIVDWSSLKNSVAAAEYSLYGRSASNIGPMRRLAVPAGRSAATSFLKLLQIKLRSDTLHISKKPISVTRAITASAEE